MQRRRNDPIDFQRFQANARTDNIHNRINRADFVEVNRLDRNAVNLRFSLANALEDRLRTLFHGWRDLRRNPRLSLTALAGMTLGIGLFSAVLFFIDGSSATMTARAIAPIPIDMQRLLVEKDETIDDLRRRLDEPASPSAGEARWPQLVDSKARRFRNLHRP